MYFYALAGIISEGSVSHDLIYMQKAAADAVPVEKQKICEI